MNNINKLTKSFDKKVFGVAAGIAEHFNIDPIFIRLLFVVLALTFDYVVLLYLVLALILPKPSTELDIKIDNNPVL